MPDCWKILEPISLGSKQCRNRIMVAAHSYGYADNDGLPTDALVDYLVERAKGGVGIIVMGGTAVSMEGSIPSGHTTRNLDDRIIPWYDKISSEIHQYGGLVLDQLFHAGGQIRAREGVRIVAPSAVPHERTRGIPTELTIPEIRRIVQDYVAAASRAKRGGLDGVEVKCDQGFLIHQFLSPFFNRRDDEYGGSYERRLTFLLSILDGVRREVGEDFVIGLRITGDSLEAGDISLEDALRIVKDIDQLSIVDYIHVNGATNSTLRGYWTNHGDSSLEASNFTYLARAIRQQTRLPLVLASMVMHPSEAERIVASGIADMIAMTRSHIADPEIVTKIKEGRIDDIRPCILINQGCVGNHHLGSDVRCIQNPAAGRERELGIGTILPAPQQKVVAVVGGGIAGLETARVAALRGHEVHLFEAQGQLGGQLLLAGKLPYRQGFLDIVDYQVRQIRKSKVNVHLKTSLTLTALREIADELDILVLATGADPSVPPVYADVEPQSILAVGELLGEHRPAGKRVLVVDTDWRQNALGIAEWLLHRGHSVTVISPAFFIGEGLDIVSLTSYYSRLQSSVLLMPLTTLVSAHDGKALVRNVTTNRLEEIAPIDTVVFAAGARPVRDLANQAKELVHRVECVGSCTDALGVPEAMLQANRLARTL